MSRGRGSAAESPPHRCDLESPQRSQELHAHDLTLFYFLSPVPLPVSINLKEENKVGSGGGSVRNKDGWERRGDIANGWKKGKGSISKTTGFI